MMKNLNYEMGFGIPTWLHTYGLMVLFVMLWSLFWKGLALWHSAKRREWKWFIAFMIINTAGLFEIWYIFLFLKLKSKDLFSKE